MPDKIQRTAAHLQKKMLARYDDGLHHKHNKNHLEYRMHCRSHPCNPNLKLEQEQELNCSTGLLREFNLKTMRTRPSKGTCH